MFDGAGSGHDFYGTLWMPPTGWVNNCDGKAVSFWNVHELCIIHRFRISRLSCRAYMNNFQAAVHTAIAITGSSRKDENNTNAFTKRRE